MFRETSHLEVFGFCKAWSSDRNHFEPTLQSFRQAFVHGRTEGSDRSRKNAQPKDRIHRTTICSSSIWATPVPTLFLWTSSSAIAGETTAENDALCTRWFTNRRRKQRYSQLSSFFIRKPHRQIISKQGKSVTCSIWRSRSFFANATTTANDTPGTRFTQKTPSADIESAASIANKLADSWVNVHMIRNSSVSLEIFDEFVNRDHTSMPRRSILTHALKISACNTSRVWLQYRCTTINQTTTMTRMSQRWAIQNAKNRRKSTHINKSRVAFVHITTNLDSPVRAARISRGERFWPTRSQQKAIIRTKNLPYPSHVRFYLP